jgi:hypothetical protein
MRAESRCDIAIEHSVHGAESVGLPAQPVQRSSAEVRAAALLGNLGIGFQTTESVSKLWCYDRLIVSVVTAGSKNAEAANLRAIGNR